MQKNSHEKVPGTDGLREAISETNCFHCGETFSSGIILFDNRNFCCTGCSTVYQVLNKYGLCEYYDHNGNPGINQRIQPRADKFAFLEDATISSQLINFEEAGQAQVIFYLPQIHCSSCLWLLEHLHSIHNGIISGRVDFNKKEVTILFARQKISLRQLAETLTSIGYEPHISLNDLGQPRKKYYNRQRIFRLGVAGFCFGNIMMLSFPEYFGLNGITESFDLSPVFRYLILALSLPVFFYCAQEFFKSGWKGLQHGFLNIDTPIALAILITFGRSLYEILSGTGPGYMDSMSGIVFFMLTGRILQDRTQQSLSFDRDYTSYFPIAVNRFINGIEVPTPLPQLKKDDHISIHSNEIIPADGILVRGQAMIDYSFVTGESTPIEKKISEIIYAGGKQAGGKIELLLVKDVSQSYLTSLWNKESMRKEESNEDSFVHRLSRYFTIVLFAIAAGAAIWWYLHDTAKIWPAVTAVLIVACPCALLLSNTFTNGHIIRLFDKANLYVRNASVVERMCRVNHIVFDKTGTITNSNKFVVQAFGDYLNSEHCSLLRAVALQSQHPLSKAIAHYLGTQDTIPVENFKEMPGRGCEAWIDERHVLLGTPSFAWGRDEKIGSGTIVAFRIDNTLKGFFVIKNEYRQGIKKMLQSMRSQYRLAVISGDNDAEKQTLNELAGEKATLLFTQSPEDKLHFIESLQQQGDQVMMVGDGLNDAGALRQSIVGIAVTDSINNFSPACDAILEASQLPLLPAYIQAARRGKNIVIASFIISICYNIIGLSIAVQGTLSPLIAAILMPSSSISIVLFTWIAVQAAGRKLKPIAKTAPAVTITPPPTYQHDGNQP